MPIYRSPGAASSDAASPGGRSRSSRKVRRKKKVKARVWHDRVNARMIAVWGTAEGKVRRKSFKLTGGSPENEVERVREEALEHATSAESME